LQTGTALGVAIVTTVAVSRSQHYLAAHKGANPLAALTEGYQSAFLACAVLAGIGLALAFLLPGRPRKPAHERPEPDPAADAAAAGDVVIRSGTNERTAHRFLPPAPPAAAIADNTNQKEEQTMTIYEYLMKAVQDDARRAGERDRLLREARRAHRARRQRLVPAAPARRRTEMGKLIVSENVTLDGVIQDRPVTKASGPAAGSA
jgi:hypothetical protein